MQSAVAKFCLKLNSVIKSSLSRKRDSSPAGFLRAHSEAEPNADKQMGFGYTPKHADTKLSKCLFGECSHKHSALCF